MPNQGGAEMLRAKLKRHVVGDFVGKMVQHLNKEVADNESTWKIRMYKH
jgi:hypothetical protein